MRKIRFSTSVFPVLVALPLLTACGETRVERVGSGAVIGGTVGAAAGALCCLGSGVGAGALIGASAGAITGAVLDEPLFFNHEAEYWPYDGTVRQ